jgi:glycosyltransferase involved in cell wall biosynthesis
MRPRLAFFLPSLGGGGAERVMVTLANYCVKQGFPTEMIVARETTTYLNEVDPAIPVEFLRPKRRIQITPCLARIMRAKRFDVMLSSPRNFPPLLVKQMCFLPTRVVIREAQTNSVSLKLVKRPFNELVAIRLGYRFLYPSADAVVAPSRGVAGSLLELSPIPIQKVHVIYNPVVSPELYEKADAPLEHPWFRSNQPPVILGVGRHRPKKGFDTLLRAFARVRQETPARLVILGEGPERPNLERLAAELGVAADVDLPGFDPNPFRYMKRAGVFVLSSRYEGLPNVLIQALACGCPVVSTDCPSGPSEILDGGRYGALVPVDDVEAMAGAIVRALLGQVAPAPSAWLEQFRVEVVAEQYLRVMLGQTP